MKCVLFDIDGTLVSTGDSGKLALEQALVSAFGLPADLNGIPLGGRTDRAIARDVLAHYGLADDADNWQRYRQAYLHHLPQCLAQRQGRVLPGMEEALRSLTQRDDLVVGLLTGNIVAGAQIKLGFYSLWEHFPFGGFGDLHHHRADVAREALAACRRHVARDIPPHDVWVIGDTPLDVACARAIGAQAIAVATGSSTRDELAAAEPDWLLDDFSDWSQLSDQW